MAKLVEIAGYTPGREIPLGDGLVLGRDPGPGGVVVANREASRRHARVVLSGGVWRVEDLNSANGTFVNNVRTQDAVLAEGTTLTIGRTAFRFSLESLAGLGAPALDPFGAASSWQNARRPDSPLVQLESSNATPAKGEGPPDDALPLQIHAPRGPTAPELARAPVPLSPPPPPRRDGVWNLTIDARVARLNAAGANEAEQVRRERDILHHLFEISRTLGSILHLPALVQEILHKLLELFPAAENASLHLLEGSSLRPLAARSRDGGPIAAPPVSQTIASLAIADRQSLISFDAAEDARFVGRESIILQNVRSFMCAPLLFRDEVLGVVYVDTTDARPRFTSDDLHLFTAVGAQVAVAVKNSQLMADNLREAEVRAHLSRYLPPDLVDQVLNKQIDITPGGSLCEGTVLFSDVVGFTPMAERMSPEVLVQTLNRYFKHMVDRIFRFGGSVNRFGGDSIMALWGVPVQRDDAALQGVRAAVAMQGAIHGFNLAWSEGCSSPLRVGIGLNIGSFVVGNIGSDKHMEYTALGSQVNLAQRVESQAAGTQVLVSERVFLDIQAETVAFALPPTPLKGVGAPMPLYSVRAVRHGEHLLCAIPLSLMLDEEVLTGMAVSLGPELSLEVWATQPLPVGTLVNLELSPPEHPQLARLAGLISDASPLDEFHVDAGRSAWRLKIRLEGPLPPLLSPPHYLMPAPGREYLPRK